MAPKTHSVFERPLPSRSTTFRTVILTAGKTATGIRVPDDVVAALGTGRRPAVRVTINGFTYRSTVAPMRGVFMLPVNAQVREGAGVAGGDTVDVTLELDTAPREVSVPPDLRKALDRAPAARRFFDELSFSNKQRHVLSIEGAKAADTRQRRIERSVSMFLEGRA